MAGGYTFRMSDITPGRLLREARLRAGLTQFEAGLRAGSTQANISTVEMNHRLIGGDMLTRLAEVYGMTSDEVYAVLVLVNKIKKSNS